MSDVFGALDIRVLRGNVESFDGHVLRGWVADGTVEPLRLRIVANGVVHGEQIADEPRDDVVAAGFTKIGSGFSIAIPEHFFAGEPCLVELFDVRNEAQIPGSPYHIEARPLAQVAAQSADFSVLSDTIIGLSDKINDVAQLQANVAMILTWLQKNVDRANALRQMGRSRLRAAE